MWFWIILGSILLARLAYKAGLKQSRGGSKTISKTTASLAKKGIGKRRTSRKFAVIEKPKEEPSAEGRRVIKLLEDTDTNIFLTGKAGTGKSTLLRYFRATTRKNVVVLAPTGVAAVNVQGQTIHSFFKFGPQVTLDLVRRKFGESAKVYKNVDTIIIDEISMVRADLFDCVDKFMRLNGPSKEKPFGGVQVFVIGDLFQLPPIVKSEEENIFRKLYRSPFFFDADAYDEAGFVKIELTHVYRQTDTEFIKTLDAFRVSSFTDRHLKLINSRVVEGYVKPKNEFVISLVTKNSVADAINVAELSRLRSSPQAYIGLVTGEFKERDLPTPQELMLKEGAQVMLLSNEPRGKWVNGDVVKVIKVSPGSVRVIFDDDTFEDVGPHKWDSIRFIYDEETKKVRSEIVGSYTQIPIKLAWAVTIHKGQGKTFEKIHVDFGDGTFAPGQAYVALSRCKTLEGIVLANPVEDHHVFSDERVKEFMALKD